MTRGGGRELHPRVGIILMECFVQRVSAASVGQLVGVRRGRGTDAEWMSPSHSAFQSVAGSSRCPGNSSWMQTEASGAGRA